MKRFFVLILLLIIPFFSNAQNELKFLEKAYKKQSKPLLNEFFLNWHQEVKPFTNDELKMESDTVKLARQVYNTFYSTFPFDSLMGDGVLQRRQEKEFLVIQNYMNINILNKVYYTDSDIDSLIVDEVNRAVSNDSIKKELLKRKNGKLSDLTRKLYGYYIDEKRIYSKIYLDFRPTIDTNIMILYLTDKYQLLLERFYITHGKKKKQSFEDGQLERTNRRNFLNHYISAGSGLLGGSIRLYSYPICLSINFDNKFEYAEIPFQYGSNGGIAYLKNENNKWRIVQAKLTWVE